MAKIFDSVDAAKGRKQAVAEIDEAVQQSLGKIRHKLLVMSGKGGVGKTSTAVNIAIALSQRGYRVGLMDVDLHGPDVIRMLGLKGMIDVDESRKLAPLAYSDKLKAVSIEALIPSKDDAIIWRGPLKFSAIRQFISHVSWGELDFLIIDSPPGTGDEPLTIAQTVSDAQAVIVTTSQEISLADVRKSISFCRTVKLTILGLIENMGPFPCPHCGQQIELFGQGGGAKTARDAGVPFLGSIPFEPRLAVGEKSPSENAPAAAAFQSVADAIASRLSGDAP